jgi:hypothetical protein
MTLAVSALAFEFIAKALLQMGIGGLAPSRFGNGREAT